jgi:hypothetical protein
VRSMGEPRASPAVAWLAIVAECAHALGADHGAVLGRSRSRTSALARRFAWWRLYDERGLSYPEIGRASGHDHTTVRAGVMLFAREAGVINPPLPKRRGEGFRESDVEHATQLVSCFDRAPYRHSRPQAERSSDSHERVKPSQH